MDAKTTAKLAALEARKTFLIGDLAKPNRVLMNRERTDLTTQLAVVEAELAVLRQTWPTPTPPPSTPST